MSGIGQVLGKIFSKGAESIVGAIGKAIDDNVTNKEEKMLLNNEMQKIVTAHVQEMEKLSIERARLEIEDRDSARKMQMAALAQNDTFSKRFVYYLAAFVLVSSIVCCVSTMLSTREYLNLVHNHFVSNGLN